MGFVACAEREPEAEPVTSLQTERPAARLYERADRPTRMYGAPLAEGASPRASAETFRTTQAAVFGVEPDELVLERVPTSLGASGQGIGLDAQGLMYDRATGRYRFSLYRYGQVKDGIPVYGASLRVVVRNESPYPAVLAISALRDLGGMRAQRKQGVVDRAKANAAVRDVHGRTDFSGRKLAPVDPRLHDFSEPELVVWAGVEDDRVAPRVAVTYVADNYGQPNAPRPEKWRFVADADSGDILHAESLIVFDVSGTVSGRVTDGAREMRCDPEAAIALPYADVSILGGNSATTDTSGAYTISHAGGSMVTVESPITGAYFEIFDADSARDEVLQTMVLPPGPANFVHNDVGVTTEFLTGQTNGYANANEVRDWVLSQHPTYPDVSGQVRFPVRVNRADDICPGNAWYDGSSINFCRSFDHPSPVQQDYGNTAFASVSQHEYGHHLVQVAGSGQDEYGEGMADVVAMLIADDPRLGLGFFLDDCTTELRNADNACQYDAMNCSDCGSEIHACGMLISGAVWDLRQALDATDPGNALDVVSNLALNSILLHTGTAIDPQITIDFLTLDDDDGNIDNGTPHATEICSAFGAHGLDCPPAATGLTVSPTADFASQGPAGGLFTPASKVYSVENLSAGSIDYEVTTAAAWLTLTNASGTLAPGATASVTVQLASAASALPPGVHTAVVSFTNASDGDGDTTRDVTLEVGRTVVASWTFDTNPGWFAQGAWAFGMPTGGGGTVGMDNFGNPDPTSGATGANVYGYNLAGNYANGEPERHLTSTAIDLSNMTHVTLKYQRWLCVEESLYDHAYVRVSTNGTTWVDVWSNQHTLNGGSWVEHEIDISGVANLQSTVYLRWTMGTTDAGWTYCGWNIDDVEVSGIQVPGCTDASECDDGLYCNGVEDCVASECVAGTAVACDDGIACTDDFCDEANDACDVTLDHVACDDGVFCNGVEQCDAQNGCEAGAALTCNDGVTCTVDSCDEGDDMCVNAPSDVACDNGTFCDGVETCHLVLGCLPGLGNPCDDGVACTSDDCNEGSDACDYVPNDAACANGAYCDGVETCHATLGCQVGTAVDCSDGVACTDDACDEAQDDCDHIPDDGACDDDAYCNGVETCHPTLDCQAGTSIDCGDGVACTVDTCNEAADACNHVASDAACANGDYCDGDETCDPTLGCQTGTPIACDDGVACTADSCDEAADDCDHVPDDGACDDSAYCNGDETCHATLGCQVGAEPCAGLSCDESGDVCVSPPVDAGGSDAGATDAGSMADAGSTVDAGSSTDAATPIAIDAGTSPPGTGGAGGDDDAGGSDPSPAIDAALAPDADATGGPDARDASAAPPVDVPLAGTGSPPTASGDGAVADDAGSGDGRGSDGGCGCRAVGGRSDPRFAPLLVLLLLAAVASRARRRRSLRADAVGR